MGNPANIRETRTALGFKKQTALQTINGSGEYFSSTKINATLNDVRYTVETDAADIGKGDEFAGNKYATAIDVTGSLEKILSSQFAAWAFGFGLGKSTQTTAGAGYKYTITLQDPVTDGIEMPAFTYVETIRQGTGAVIDRAAVGCVVNEITLALKSGPGRQNAMLTAGIVGSGFMTEPSGVTVPTLTAEAFLNAGSATLDIMGTDYRAAKSFSSFDLSIRNNVRGDTGYYPGSGTNAEGFQVRGRMESGDREHTMTLKARYAHDSTELASLKALTEGTVVITLTGAAIDGSNNHSLKITYHRVVFTTGTVDDEAGIVGVTVTMTPMRHATNGVVTVEVVTDMTGIMSAGA